MKPQSTTVSTAANRGNEMQADHRVVEHHHHLSQDPLTVSFAARIFCSYILMKGGALALFALFVVNNLLTAQDKPAQIKPAQLRTVVQDKAAAKAEEADADAKDADAKDAEAKEGENQDPNKITLDGPLGKAAEPLAKILKLNWERDSVKFELPQNYAEANESLNELRTLSRGGGGGHGSEGYWVQSFYGQTMGGVLQRGSQRNGRSGQENSLDDFRVHLTEIVDDNRELSIVGSDLSQFDVLVNGGFSPLRFHMQQAKGGGVTVQDIENEQTFVGSAKTFQDFCRKYPVYVQDRLMPVLKAHGIKAPITRFNPVARDQVLAAISELDPKLESSFKERFADLNSPTFAKREAATKLLTDQFEEWKDVIRHTINDEVYSLETRARLKKVLDEKSSEEDRQLISMVVSSKLTEDAEYLVWLLENCEDPAQTAALTRQLKLITKEEFGDDVAAWKTWIAKSAPAVDNDFEAQSTELSKEVGYLQGLAEPLSQMLVFKLVEDRLVIDRDNWSKQFNGKTIKELVELTKADIQKRNLPAAWFNSQVSMQDDQVDYAQVFFFNMQNSIPARVNNSYYYGYNNIYAYRQSTLNRHFEQPHITGTIDFHKTQGPDERGVVKQQNTDVEFMRLHLREREENQQTLEVYEGKDQALRIFITSLGANAAIYLNQTAEGKIVFHDLRGGKLFKTADAENARAFFEANGEYCKKELLPIFANYGLQISEELGGPLEIKNQQIKRAQ
jgi:hypothetical protein